MRKIAMAIDTPMPGNISYDEFIALCFIQMKGRDPDGQRDITLVGLALHSRVCQKSLLVCLTCRHACI